MQEVRSNIIGLHHVAISARDIEKSTQFYEDLLGLKPVFEFVFADGGGLHRPADAPRMIDVITGLSGSTGSQAMLRAPNAHIELFEWVAPLPKPRDPEWTLFDHGITHVCFQVDDLDGWHQRLTAAGVQFTSAPQTFGPVKNVYALDPDGNLVELIEPLAAGARLELPDLEFPSGFESTTSVEGVHHVGISVASMAETTAFYENCYGVRPLGDGIDFSDGRFDALWGTTGSAGVASFINLGNAFLEVFDFENPSPKPRDEAWRVCDHGFTHFSFQLSGLAEFYEELQAKNVRFISPPLEAPRVIANYSYDHDDNIVELFEPTEAGAMLSIATTTP